ncbi:MAG: nucleoside phosphorylase [Bacteroidota bacterium]
MNSELILNADGSLYHLNLLPGEVAEKIILVGDPGRVQRIGQRFDTIELQKQKREFHTLTGTLRGQRLTVISTGIGPSNVDIVLNEVDALFNIDLNTNEPKEDLTSLKFLRLGTCGGVQADIPVGTLVNSRFAIGTGSMMQYYQSFRMGLWDTFSEFEAAVTSFFEEKGVPYRGYAAQGASSLHKMIDTAFPAIKTGITYTVESFYGGQGRYIGRLSPSMEDLPGTLASFSFQDMHILNIEMEAATVMALANALGHEAGTICVILANRAQRQFAPNPSELVETLIDKGLVVMLDWG